MATASTIKLSPSLKPTFGVPNISQESADKANQLLQENHDSFDIFFNSDGLHNHITHHLLSLYAVGASPDALQRHYDDNKNYQRDITQSKESVVDKMLEDPAEFDAHLFDRNRYKDYLKVFQHEIEKKGWQKVIVEYMFAGTPRADDMLVRMFAGFLHPIIHLGFGVEFEQPAIIAEAFAQAACHDKWIGDVLVAAEKRAKENSNKGRGPSLLELMKATTENEKLRDSPHFEDSNKLRDGVLGRASGEMVEIASRYVVQPDELEERLAEMINFNAYFTVASQRPHEELNHKIDFFYMHHMNCSIFFPAFIRSSFLTPAQKARLLEWKGRFDLAGYVSRACPELYMEDVRAHTSPRAHGSWNDLMQRVIEIPDDGHSVKLLRALANGEQVCRGMDGEKEWGVKGPDWFNCGMVAIDSVERTDEPRWLRSTGFLGAWSEVKKRDGSKL